MSSSFEKKKETPSLFHFFTLPLSHFFFQTDPSRTMLNHLPEDFIATDVLLIGSFSSNAERRVRNRFPKAQITSITDATPLPRREREIAFDLILVNAHLDRIRFKEGEGAEQLSRLLVHDGFLAMRSVSKRNGTTSPRDDATSSLECLLSRWQTWSFFRNVFSTYRHFGQGHVGDPVPEGYFDRQQSRMNLEACTKSSAMYTILGEPGRIGLRSKLGPFVTEDYFTDEEPVIEPCPLPRTIKWQPMTISERTGWKRHPFPGDVYQKGVGVITSNNQETYWKDWSQHAQRHRTKWLRDERYEMVDVTLDEFAHAYHASKKLDWLTRTGFVRVLKFHAHHQPHALRLFAARDKQTGQLVAGLALAQFDDIHQSFHTVSFICDSVRQTSVGVGLIDHWYKRGIAEGVRFFNFGIVWQEGDPGAWKGYSKFKRQFHLYLICYPKPLVKFVWGSHHASS